MPRCVLLSTSFIVSVILSVSVSPSVTALLSFIWSLFVQVLLSLSVHSSPSLSVLLSPIVSHSESVLLFTGESVLTLSLVSLSLGILPFVSKFTSPVVQTTPSTSVVLSADESHSVSSVYLIVMESLETMSFLDTSSSEFVSSLLNMPVAVSSGL